MNTHCSPSWKSIVNNSQEHRIFRIAQDLGNRFRVEIPTFSRNTLANGPAGVAVACAQLEQCFPSEGWGDLAKNYVLHALRMAAQQKKPNHWGLFEGLAGLAWSVLYVAGGSSDGQKILTRLDQLLIKHVEIRPKIVFDSQGRTPSHVYDLITGLSGVSLYFIERANNRMNKQLASVFLNELIMMMGGLDKSKSVWDLGLAHGLPGVLAVLAKGSLNGFQNPKLEKSIYNLAHYLISFSLYDDWGITWPSHITATQQTLHPARTAWCYGTPGVARALWLAGQSLQDAELQEIASQAMKTCCKRPRAYWGVTTPMFCHGLSGITQILLRFYHDTGIEMFAQTAQALVTEICDEYDSNLAYGFRNLDLSRLTARRATLKTRDVQDVSPPGLLEGAAGIVLVLLAASQNLNPAWDKVFALS